MNKNPPCEIHAVIFGRVQGVGFRYTACNYAKNLGLSGTVRNCPDGSVEIYAQGEKPILEKFLTLLQDEFQISSIELNFSTPKITYEKFLIADSF